MKGQVYHFEQVDDNHIRLTPQRESMKIEKPSIVLAAAGWISVFLEGWLLLLQEIPSNGLSWGFFVFFFIVAMMATAVYSGKTKPPKTDIRVRMGDQIFSEENGNLTITRNGTIALCEIKPDPRAVRSTKA